MVKEISFWDGEQVQSIRIGADASKGISEVTKALDVSLNHIDTYRYNGEIPLLLGKTTDSGGGGVTESLSSEKKNIVRIILFYCIVNCFLNSQYKPLHKRVEQFYGEGCPG